MTHAFARRALRALYAINAVAAAAAAVVLAIAPSAIPAVVGLTITPSANLLAYLLAAAELALASMCGIAIRSRDRAVDLQTVTVLTIFHVASALAGLAIVTSGEGALVLCNVLARVVIVAALVSCARRALKRE